MEQRDPLRGEYNGISHACLLGHRVAEFFQPPGMRAGTDATRVIGGRELDKGGDEEPGSVPALGSRRGQDIEERQQPGNGRRLETIEPVHDLGAAACIQTFEDGHDEGVLGGEMLVECHLGDASAGDDRVNAGGPEAGVTEEFLRGIQQLVSHGPHEKV